MANLAAEQQERKARDTNACNAAILVPMDYELIYRLSKYLYIAQVINEVNARVYSRFTALRVVNNL